MVERGQKMEETWSLAAQRSDQREASDIGDRHDSITECLTQLCLSNEMADVTFTFQDQIPSRIPAHKMILAMRSEIFESLFYGEYAHDGSVDTVEVIDIKPNIFQHMLRFIYTDQVDLTRSNATRLLYASDKYKIKGLIDLCESFLAEGIFAGNVCSIYVNAKRLSRNKLKLKTLSFIQANAKQVFRNENFLSLSADDLEDILKMDTLRIQELDIFLAVMKWVEAKLLKAKVPVNSSNKRMWMFPNILYLMALPSLSIEEFTSAVIPSGVLTNEEQLSLFKAITMKQMDPTCKFRTQPRKLRYVLKISLGDIFPQFEPCQRTYGKPNAGNIANMNTTESIYIKPYKRICILSADVNLYPHFPFQKELPDGITCTARGLTYESICDVNGRCSITLDFEVPANETDCLQFTLSESNRVPQSKYGKDHAGRSPIQQFFARKRDGMQTMGRINSNWKKYWVQQNNTRVDFSIDGMHMVSSLLIYVLD